MAKNETVVCSYKHCKHKEKEVQKEKAVKVGNRYMHSDCAITSSNMLKIRDTYFERVSKTVVMKQLMSVLNNIVFKKDVDSSYLLFALNYAINNKIPIKSPYSLHYIIDYNNIKDAWKKKQVSSIKKEIEIDESLIMDNKPSNFKYTKEDNVGFSGIFGGGN